MGPGQVFELKVPDIFIAFHSPGTVLTEGLKAAIELLAEKFHTDPTWEPLRERALKVMEGKVEEICSRVGAKLESQLLLKLQIEDSVEPNNE
jgi:hypothetical protein